MGNKVHFRGFKLRKTNRHYLLTNGKNQIITVVVWLMCQLSLAQEEDTAIVSDTTDDLWFLTEGESEQVSVEMKEAALEEGSREGEPPLEDDDGGMKEDKADREVCLFLSFLNFVIYFFLANKMFFTKKCGEVMWSDVYLLDAGGARWRLSVSEWWYWYRDLHTGQYLWASVYSFTAICLKLYQSCECCVYILGCMAVHRVPKIQHTSPEVLCSVLGSKEELV